MMERREKRDRSNRDRRYRRTFFLPGALLLLLCLLVPGNVAADDWPMFMKDRSHSSRGEAPRPPLKVKWEFATDDSIFSSPVVYGGRLFVGSYDTHLYALDAGSGKLLWRFKTGGEILSTPAVYNDRVIFGSKDGVVYALDLKDGTVAWQYKTEGRVLTSPVVGDGKVFFASNDLRIYALNGKSGKLIWRVNVKDYKYSGFYSSPAYQSGVKEVTEIITAGDGSGSLKGKHFTLNTLNEDYYVWYNSDSSGTDPSPVGRIGIEVAITGGASASSVATATAAVLNDHEEFSVSVSGRVLTVTNSAVGDVVDAEGGDTNFESFNVRRQGVDGIVFQGGKTTRFYAFNGENRAREWAYVTLSAIYASPTLHNGVLYFTSNDRTVYGVDASTGRAVFIKPLGGWAYSSPVVYRGILYIALKNGVLKGFNLKNGSEKVYFNFPDEVNSTMAVSGNGVAYIGCEDHKLYAIELGRGKARKLWSYKTRGGVHSSPALTGDMVYVASKDGSIYAFGR